MGVTKNQLRFGRQPGQELTGEKNDALSRPHANDAKELSYTKRPLNLVL
jgi:hypothetical protein